MEFSFRPETLADYPSIFEVNTQAFGQENEARLIHLLREDVAFIPALSWVALNKNQVIGHILFSKIQIVNAEGKSYESLALAPISVLPAYQNQGIGGKLIQAGLAQARQLGFKSVIVLGHPHYYPKFGFLPAHHWQIEAPFLVSQAAFMALALTPDGLQNVHGRVVYPSAFEIV